MSSKASVLFPSSWEPAWNDFLEAEAAFIEGLPAKLGNNYTPAPECVLRFTRFPLNTLKVVILGQDPYPAAGVAIGRAFEVGGLTGWDQPFRQASLKNIVRAVYGAYGGNPYACYSDIIRAAKQGGFSLAPPDKLFASWEEQGVLLLNTALTTPIGVPGGHIDIWRGFSERLIGFISENMPNAYWFLWGNHAQSFSSYIKSGVKFHSRHPMLCSEKWQDDFLKNPCFKETAHLIKWAGE
jgi:uracil-DNA glycosylase